MSNTIHYMLFSTSLQTQSNLRKGNVNHMHKYWMCGRGLIDPELPGSKRP